MKGLYLLVFVLFTSPLFAQSPAPEVIADSFPLTFNYHRDFRRIKTMTEQKSHPYNYQKLIIRFLNNDSSLTRPEVLALMIGFTDNTHYKPLENMEIEKEIIELNDNGFFEDALEETKKYLQKNPLSLSANKERSYAYHKTGNTDSARYFMDLNNHIMEAMIFSGGAKGKTPDNAFFSLGLNDGDYFIPNVGFSVTKKSLSKDKNRYTLYVVQSMNIESAYTNYYFNIHHAKMKADQDGISERKPKKLENAKKKRAAKGKGKGKKGAVTDSTATDEPEMMPTDSLPSEIISIDPEMAPSPADSLQPAAPEMMPTDSIPAEKPETLETPEPTPLNTPPSNSETPKGPSPLLALNPESRKTSFLGYS
ncbi:MAG TPA: DUF4919 domain-containing protein [Ferruginibacter sp.]|nr:hypothetical protein [Chitinophagaceae bacterium]HML58101.1 DUF4919 domain-containing protein [Ferruginibacter sp.]HRO06315.1 DUF4919 domain-containing protein [Ferruginibacter sp.]